MKNQQLIQEVIQQISQRFTPKIPDIKKVGTLMQTGCRRYDRELTCAITGDRPLVGEGVHRACGGHAGHLRIRCLKSHSDLLPSLDTHPAHAHLISVETDVVA